MKRNSGILYGLIRSIPFITVYFLLWFDGKSQLIMLLPILVVLVPYLVYLRMSNKYVDVLLIFLFLAIFQNLLFVTFIGLNPSNNSRLTLFLGIKDIVITLFFLFCITFWVKRTVFKELKLKTISDKLIILWGIILLVEFLFSKQPVASRIMYIRNFFYPFIFFYLGMISVKYDRMSLNKVTKFIICLSLLLALFSIYEKYLFTPETYLSTFHIEKLYQAKLGHSQVFPQGWPPRYTTSILGASFKRAGSFLFEPVNLSYFFVLSLAVVIFLKTKHRMLISTLVAAGLIFSVGKGGFVVLFITLAMYIIAYKFHLKMNITRLFLFFLIFLGFSFFFGTTLSKAVQMHKWGLLYGLKNLLVKPSGYGLGFGGNFGYMVSQEFGLGWLESGAESLVGVIATQLGIIGLLLWLLAHFSIMDRLLKVSHQMKKTNKTISTLGAVVSFMLLALFVISFFQENVYGTQICAPYFILAGIIVGVEKYRSRTKTNSKI